MSTPFQLGQLYSRDQIHNQLGGSKESYLPTKNGRVVCGAFRKDANPGAPLIILPGKGKIIESAGQMFARQSTPVPVFIKKEVNAWEYVGDFRVSRLSRDPKELALYAARANRSDAVSMILFLQHAS